MKKLFISLGIWSLIASILVVGSVYADSTIGTNMSTTGTLTVTTGSATAVRFQNAAGTTLFQFDTSSTRLGIGDTAGTTFEVQGTASASYFLTGNTIQVGGFSSVAYNRFGTNTTTYSDNLSTTNDFLISGNLEVDLRSFFDAPAEFQGTASASYLLTGNTLQVGGFSSVAYSRFGTGTTSHSGYVATSADLLISGDLEVNGTSSFDGFTTFVNASSSGNFELTAGTGALFGINAGGNINTMLEIGGTASISTVFAVTKFVTGADTASNSLYTAEFGGDDTSSVSILFGSNSSSVGTCFQMKNTVGAWVYARIEGTTWTVNTTECNQ